MRSQFRCILHGSFGRHFSEIKAAAEIFAAAGIEVLAPRLTPPQPAGDGFARFEDEQGQDARLIELLYLHNLKRLGPGGFSYFVNPGGYLGRSAAYELGVAQTTNTKCFFSQALDDHPAYLQGNSIWSPQDLAAYITQNDALPQPQIEPNESQIHRLWQELVVPGSVVAAGAIIEYQPRRHQGAREVLLVKTHKWGHRYSIVGGKVRMGEGLDEALLREVKEETGLRGNLGRHLCTFDEIKGSGYHQPGQAHIFVDKVVSVSHRRVQLNDEAQSYLWAPADEALATLDIEPNARHTLELYTQLV